jgi:hypothetical protein
MFEEKFHFSKVCSSFIQSHLHAFAVFKQRKKKKQRKTKEKFSTSRVESVDLREMKMIFVLFWLCISMSNNAVEIVVKEVRKN